MKNTGLKCPQEVFIINYGIDFVRFVYSERI